MKTHYLTNDEIDYISFRIYNNLPTPLDESLSQADVYEVNEEVVKELTQGAEYIHVEEDPRYIITQTGRLINAHRINVIKPTALSKDLLYMFGDGTKVYYSKHFERAGWEWDYKKILKTYRDNKWAVKMHDPAVKLLNEIE